MAEQQETKVQEEQTAGQPNAAETKFCKHCGATIDKEAVICIHCGKQVEEVSHQSQPNIVINNANTSSNVNSNTNINSVVPGVKPKNKWVAFCLCLFLGYFGAHKFYEGKTGMGILYLCTFGLCGIGWIIDLVALLSKPNPYYF